jgi:tRNA A37 methylthiotransferase MiaB
MAMSPQSALFLRNFLAKRKCFIYSPLPGTNWHLFDSQMNEQVKGQNLQEISRIKKSGIMELNVLLT